MNWKRLVGDILIVLISAAIAVAVIYARRLW